jgi:HK97 gp10 family phage protein
MPNSGFSVQLYLGPEVNTRLIHLEHITDEVFYAVVKAFKEVGKYVQTFIWHKMSTTTHAPWFYTRSGGGVHYPSAPLQYPAIDTHNLFDKILHEEDVNFPIETSVWIGPDPSVYYAGYLEDGTSKMEKRPFIDPTFMYTKANINRIILQYIHEALQI